MRRIMHNREQDGDQKMQEFAAYMREGSPFRRLETLAGFVTMGCNMPLFTFTFGPDKIVPITKARTPTDHPAFPGVGLQANVKSKARWLNFYSRNDLLGYPLKPLNGAYAAEPLISDIPVVSEGRLKRFLCSPYPALATYAAHTGYWTHRAVIRGTVELLTDLITADDPAPPPAACSAAPARAWRRRREASPRLVRPAVEERQAEEGDVDRQERDRAQRGGGFVLGEAQRRDRG